MGNRVSLTFGRRSQFEANNCLPIIWLTLFDPSDYFKREEEDDEGETAIIVSLQTAPAKANKRIKSIKGYSPVQRVGSQVNPWK